MKKRVFLIVLDSVGIGEQEDSHLYGDKGSNTLKSCFMQKDFSAPNMKEMFIKGARGKSAKDEIDTLLYNHSYCAESINISSIPIYFLEPNTCIYISDSDTGV